MNIKEVQSPIDLRNKTDAELWEKEASIKRPWRSDFFNFYVQYIKKNKVKSILELGSGAGNLSFQILNQCSDVCYTPLDLSKAMHDLARSKLSIKQLKRVNYFVRDFKEAYWHHDLGVFDVIIIHQALHELRHKDYAQKFHSNVKHLMKSEEKFNAKAMYFVCDHLYAADAMQNDQLYMTKHEHIFALEQAGFINIQIALEIKSLCLFQCESNV